MTAFKAIGLAVVVGAACAFAIPSQAQDWPNRPVRVVVPFGAGGAADRLGRIAADHLSKARSRPKAGVEAWGYKLGPPASFETHSLCACSSG
jgi:tripartite-type tricarboxylate transporter receptor subunit TctC